MAKNKSNPTGARQTNTAPAKPAPPKPVQQSLLKRYGYLLIPAAIALVTWLFLNTCLDNKLTNWDDPSYIRDNALIKDLSGDGLKNILTTSIMGNYHPLTILSYAIEYSYVRLDPWLYHLDSLLLHILMTILVYSFVNILTRRPVAAAVTALLFALHPMHMESVAWLSGRKDVLYGSFYMASCIAYICYVRTTGEKKRKWYAVILLLFICALLAKPVAVVLPVTLLLIDGYEQRKLDLSLLIEKIPMFALSLGFGIQSILDQKRFGALDTQDISYTLLDRILLGTYALITYLWKAVVPVDLSCFYPYPEKPSGSLPGVYYIYPLLVAILVFLAWKFLRKDRIAMFGILFFGVNIVLLLQFIPVGGAIIADRYSYLPYLGLFFIAGWYVSSFFEAGGSKQLAYPVLGGVVVYVLTLGHLSNERCKVWYDTVSLWSNVIETQPRTPNAYNNLGFEYFNRYNTSVNAAEKKRYYDSSYSLLSHAISLQEHFINPYISLGELLRTTGQYAEAKKNYYKALTFKGDDKVAEAYLGLAIIYAINTNFDSSGYCFRQAITRKPFFPEAHSNYGNYLDMTGHRDSAIVQYTLAISQNPDMDAFYLNRGRAEIGLGKWDDAMKDFEQAITINPNLGDNYYARSVYYNHIGNKARALQDAQKAMSLGFTAIDKNYYQSLQH